MAKITMRESPVSSIQNRVWALSSGLGLLEVDCIMKMKSAVGDFMIAQCHLLPNVSHPLTGAIVTR